MLLDHSILTNDSRLYTVKEDPPPEFLFGNKMLGVRRKPVASSPLREKELVAIYTIARLIREERVSAFSSTELLVEGLKDYFPAFHLRATADCKIDYVPAPIERAKFVKTDLGTFVNKGRTVGGKADRSITSQLSFFSWLIDLTKEDVERIIGQPESRGLTAFECESLRSLDWFKTMRARAQTDQHLPDLFHIWTALRNEISVFLTIDEKLIRMIRGIAKEKSGFKVGVKVISPLEFLEGLGIYELDRFECEFDRFYWLDEVSGMF